jgi:PBSX family phage terminase large subunit
MTTEDLSAYKPFYTHNMPAQRRFMESTKQELLLSGAFGGGKSLPGCEKGLSLSLRYPGNYGAVVRKTYQSLKQTTMVTWFDDVCLPQHQVRFNATDHIYEFINGSKVLFMGLDEPQKAGSLNLGWVFIDEASEMTEDDYKMLLGRLRLNKVPVRQMFLATNPANVTHWLYNRFYKEGGFKFSYDDERAKEMMALNEGTLVHNQVGDLVGVREAWKEEQIGEFTNREVLESNSLQNPYLPPDYIDLLSGYTGVYRDRFVLGKWIGFEGLVYDEYDESVHHIAPFEIPGDWARYQSIDYGYTNPHVTQWWAVHPVRERSQPTIDTCICQRYNSTSTSSGHEQYCLDAQPVNCACPAPTHEISFYMYREIYMSQRRVEQHAEMMRRFPDPAVLRFSDHDAGDRATMERQGFPTAKANKEIEPGIQTCKRLLHERRAFFFKEALIEKDNSLSTGTKRVPTCTVEEFSSYYWVPPKLGINDKEIPSDADNHGMDAMRYFLHTYHFQTSAQRVLAQQVTPRMKEVASSGGRDWRGQMSGLRDWRKQ